jgi:phosphoribosyl 1,2-cyclic phosphodiesterase
VHLRDIPKLILHDLVSGTFEIGEFVVSTAFVCHPGPTVGYRIAARAAVVTYLPDHEPALGVAHFPLQPEWTSGYALAQGADLLIHDAQYSRSEYPEHVGWGHSMLDDTLTFAALAGVKHLVTFHHDPAHDDDDLERLSADAMARTAPALRMTVGREGAAFALPTSAAADPPP